jgi:hypothetical protein
LKSEYTKQFKVTLRSIMARPEVPQGWEYGLIEKFRAQIAELEKTPALLAMDKYVLMAREQKIAEALRLASIPLRGSQDVSKTLRRFAALLPRKRGVACRRFAPLSKARREDAKLELTMGFTIKNQIARFLCCLSDERFLGLFYENFWKWRGDDSKRALGACSLNFLLGHINRWSAPVAVRKAVLAEAVRRRHKPGILQTLLHTGFNGPPEFDDYWHTALTDAHKAIVHEMALRALNLWPGTNKAKLSEWYLALQR